MRYPDDFINKIICGDCIDVMKEMPENCIDAIVTDPPYGLEFMGKEWDKIGKNWGNSKLKENKDWLDPRNGCLQKHNPASYKNYLPRFSSQDLKDRQQMQRWHTQWLTEAYRVLKPGGSMLVMGGTRTFHRLACAIEDSGFIIKDTLMWFYGSGFPKAQEISTLVDAKILGINMKEVKERREKINKYEHPQRKNRKYHKTLGFGKGRERFETQFSTKPLTPEAQHWNGFKVGGIKPAYEPIVWAVKPPEGSYVDNVLKWGVGAVNVDECRVGIDNNEHEIINNRSGKGWGTNQCAFGGRDEGKFKSHSKGRFPANILLFHHPECVQVGVKRVKGERHSGKPGHGKDGQIYGKGIVFTGNTKCYVDKDGLEIVESWQCHPDCPVRMLDEQSGGVGGDTRKSKSTYDKGIWGNAKPIQSDALYSDSGGASRFFYCAKASRSERNRGLEDSMINGKRKKGEDEKLYGQSGGANQALKDGKSEYLQEGHIGLNKIKIVKNNHPTVKPIKLFEWLIRLVTREGQVVLDPFLGSGTTAIAAHNAGRKCVGIEKEEEYLGIAKKRIEHWEGQPKQMELK